MVNLGGSECIVKTWASGKTMEEEKSIKLSFSSLGEVINALQMKQPHIPYRYLNLWTPNHEGVMQMYIEV